MTQLIGIIFIILAIAILIGIMGTPVFIVIHLIKQTRKTGKFPWKKAVVIVGLLIIAIIGIKIVLGGTLNKIGNKYGVNDTIDIVLPTVQP